MSKPNILTDIEKLKLIGKYHIPRVVRYEHTTGVVDYTLLPTSWEGSGNSFSRSGYTIESPMAPQNNNNFLSSAFDGNPNSLFRGISSPSNLHVTITFPVATAIASFTTIIVDNTSLSYLKLEGSNNKTDWTQLSISTSSVGSDSIRTVDESSRSLYKYYRFTVVPEDSSGSAITLEIREIKINQHVVEFENAAIEYNISSLPVLEENSRILLSVPLDVDLYKVASNFLNGRPIDLVLTPGKFYELINISNRYVAKEVS